VTEPDMYTADGEEQDKTSNQQTW